MKGFLYSFLAVVGAVAFADVKPGTLQCKVVSVTPVDAHFFGFSSATFPGDTAELDLSADSIPGILFASGAKIGHTSIPHPLLKTQTWEGHSYHGVEFQSHHNKNTYIGALIADDNEDGTTTVTVDAVERPKYGRLSLNSAELTCTRP